MGSAKCCWLVCLNATLRWPAGRFEVCGKTSLQPRQAGIVNILGSLDLALLHQLYTSVIRYKEGQLNHLSTANPTIWECSLMTQEVSNPHSIPVCSLVLTYQYHNYQSTYVHDLAQPPRNHKSSKSSTVCSGHTV